ncbi:MAG TPA: DUF4397 domain-containing protein [Candidatus Binatia bacterium]|nr:DUF4397 domain-containing protein [Candidatus Binatia bacterium]
MKKQIRTLLGVALLCAAMSPAMFASDNAYLYLLQGIPGHDYSSSTDPQFPVDILLNGEVCYQRGLGFGVITGPLTFAPGSYDVKISIADSVAPCTNEPVVDTTVTLNAGENESLVLTFGSTGSAETVGFNNSFASVSAGNARIQFAHAADATAVTLTLKNTSTQKSYTYTVNPGQLLGETLPAATYDVTVTQGSTTLVSTTSVTLDSQSVELMYIVGEAGNNTVNLETKSVKNVI